VTALFLVFLGCAWVVLLAPGLLRARRSTPVSTSRRFRRSLETIAPRAARTGRWVLAPASSGNADRTARRAFARAQRRRRKLLIAVALCVPALLATALVAKSWWWWAAFGGSVGALAAYVALLVEARKQRARSMRNVRALAGRQRTRSESDYAERRA
jgi:nucleotide-binding universal stress UspA family protein